MKSFSLRLFIFVSLLVFLVSCTSAPAPSIEPVATSVPSAPTSIVTIAPTAMSLLKATTTPKPTLKPIDTPQPTIEPALSDRGADSLGDSLYPGMGNGGYDAQHYTIDLKVDVDNNSIDGSSSMSALATQSLSSFNLDFHGLDISQITVNASPAKFKRSLDELIVMPSEVLSQGQIFTVTVVYSGEPKSVDDPSAFGEPVGWANTADAGVFVVSEVSGAMSWFPSNNHPIDKATYTFKITANKPYVVAANGLLKNTIDNGDTQTFVWEENVPMATYLATIEVGRYKIVTGTGPKGLPIRNYFPISVLSEATQATDRTPEMIDYYSQVFGPYPFEAYGIVVVPENLGFSLEDQTLSVFGQDMLDELTVAHELSHQWFGDSISLKDWKDIWLNEGFATYAEALWIEHTEGKAAADKYMRDLYDQTQSAPGTPAVQDLFSDAVYDRGAWVLAALRSKVGDDKFFQILHEYYARFAGKSANSQDFISVAQEISGQDLKKFFDDWLYSDQMPDLSPDGSTTTIKNTTMH